MIEDHILIHYGEIALKGGNRNFFEAQLIENIKKQLDIFCQGCIEYACPSTKTQATDTKDNKLTLRPAQNNFCVGIKKMSGGILVKLNETGLANIDKIKDALMHTFGISNFSFATSVPQDIETLKTFCWEVMSKQKFETFRVTTQRSNKNFPMTSAEINCEIGGYIFEKLDGKKKVSMKNADIECKIFIINEFALVSMKKIEGLGGMPIGSGKKAMALLSGGFDSPVAAFQIMRRGVQLRYAHFHSAPYTSKASIEKVVALSQELKKFGSSTRLYLIPFADVQKEIMMKTPERFRVILYRRMMMRIAETLARKEKCLALITGDSIGQVASQTLENILAVSEAATLPIFRPLIGEDKEDIMQKAKKIGTYEISIQPHDDCCTRLMPKKPETRAKLREVLEAEKELDIPKLISETLAKIKLIKK